MQCDFCDNEANLEIKMSINGEIRTLHLCSSCYNEKMQEMLSNIPEEWGGEELSRQVMEIMNRSADFREMPKEEKADEGDPYDKAYRYQRKSLRRQRAEYTRMLEMALENEDYEHCAIYRDEINRIGDALVRLNEERKNVNGA